MSVYITVHDSTNIKTRKALDLILRLGEANMQAIADFAVRTDAAIARIEERLVALPLTQLSPEDQQMLNEIAARLEALGTAPAA